VGKGKSQWFNIVVFNRERSISRGKLVDSIHDKVGRSVSLPVLVILTNGILFNFGVTFIKNLFLSVNLPVLTILTNGTFTQVRDPSVVTAQSVISIEDVWVQVRLPLIFSINPIHTSASIPFLTDLSNLQNFFNYKTSI
jgi:hypothetical protein